MAKVKPGTPHPTKKGMVMGTKGRYVAKSTYNKQVKASQPKPARQNVTGQRALPAAGQSGGSKPPRGTRQPGTTRPIVDRRSAAAARARAAAAGARSSTVRTGAEKPVTTYSKQARDAIRKFVSKNAPKAGQALGGLAKGVGRAIAGRDDGSGSALMAAMAANDAINAVRGSTAEERNKKKEPKLKAKSGMTPAQLKAAQDKANADRRAGKLSNIPASKTKAQPEVQPKAKPKVKKGSGVSGVGPVASGRAYATAQTGKSVMQRKTESLKKMGTKSERFKKLAAEEKRKSLERGKKNRERKVRRGGRR